MKLADHSPLKGEKLQFVGWVMGLSLGEAPASKGEVALVPPSCVW